MGVEPGWVLEIHYDRVVLVNDYGQIRYEFPSRPPVIDQSGRATRYELQNSVNFLTIILSDQRCTETMIEETCETCVSQMLDGRSLQGCGNAMH